MKKILLVNPIAWFEDQIKKIQEVAPDILVTINYEEVAALVRAREVERVCVILGAYNYSKGGASNSAPAGIVAKELHDLSPDLPILAWNDIDNTKSCVQGGVVYLQTEDFEDSEFYSIIKAFYEFDLPTEAEIQAAQLKTAERFFDVRKLLGGK